MVQVQTRRSRGVLAFVGGSLLTLVVAALRPVPILAEDACAVASGTLIDVQEGEAWDVLFRIEGSSHTYYINRGLRRGLRLSGLRETLVGETVTFKYPRHWTPLDPMGTTHHVSKIECAGAVVFDETR